MRRHLDTIAILTSSFMLLFHQVKADDYWQQDVHYEIAVTLNPTDHTLTGVEKLTYKNNSPDTLSFVWFHLYPNAYKDRQSIFARESIKAGNIRFALASEAERGFIRVDSIRAKGKDLNW
ncbi:MAG TPA: hypothetical protein VGD14_00110, partial [bacterium]